MFCSWQNRQRLNLKIWSVMAKASLEKNLQNTAAEQMAHKFCPGSCVIRSHSRILQSTNLCSHWTSPPNHEGSFHFACHSPTCLKLVSFYFTKPFQPTIKGDSPWLRGYGTRHQNSSASRHWWIFLWQSKLECCRFVIRQTVFCRRKVRDPVYMQGLWDTPNQPSVQDRYVPANWLEGTTVCISIRSILTPCFS